MDARVKPAHDDRSSRSRRHHLRQQRLALRLRAIARHGRGEALEDDPYETLAYWDLIDFTRLIEHPARTRDNVNAHDIRIASVKGYAAFREAMARVKPDGHYAAQYMLFTSQPLGYDLWAGIFSKQWMKFLTFALIVSLAYHAWVGVRDIWMDYVKPVGVRLALHVFTLVWLTGCAGWAIQVLWRL